MSKERPENLTNGEAPQSGQFPIFEGRRKFSELFDPSIKRDLLDTRYSLRDENLSDAAQAFRNAVNILSRRRRLRNSFRGRSTG